MRFVGGDVNFFYLAEKAFSVSDIPEGEIGSKINVRRSEERQLGCIIWKGVRLDFTAYHRVTQSFTSTPVTCRSIVNVTFSEDVDTDFLKDIYWSMLQTFRYLMRGNSVTFETVELYDITSDGLSKGTTFHTKIGH